MFTIGGGYAMISLIQHQVVVAHGWISAEAFTDIIAISQMTPGPIGINSATYIGYSVIEALGYSHAACVAGSMLATIAVVLPSFLITYWICRLYVRLKDNAVLAAVLKSFKPLVIGLLAAAAIALMTPSNFIDYKSWIVRLKNFISRNLIPNIITKHDENIYNLNTILSHLGLKITSSLIENEGDDYLNVLKERIYFLNSNKIDKNFESHENRLNNILLKNTKNIIDNNYQSINRDINSDNFNNISLFPSFMNFSNYLNDTKKKDNNKFILEKQLKNIFFGDTIKIKQILGIIENKINLLEMQKNNENKSTKEEKSLKLLI